MQQIQERTREMTKVIEAKWCDRIHALSEFQAKIALLLISLGNSLEGAIKSVETIKEMEEEAK